MLAIYYNNIKGDRPAAQAVIVKGLEFDPTNTYLLTLQKQLQGTPKQTPQPKTPGKTETKTKSTSSIGGSTKTKTKTKS
jgi:hypothetical protein